MKELLRFNPERVEEVLLAKPGTDKENDRELTALLKQHHILLSFRSNHELSTLVNGTAHQGVVARVKDQRVEFKALIAEFEAREDGIILLLDSINDPHNFGAILRAAECFKVDGVIYSRNRGSGVTPTVSKTSAGASEIVKLCEVGNLAESCRRLQKEGFTLVVADVGSQAVSLEKFEFPGRIALVLGSEGDGVQPLIRKYADFLIKIPLFGRLDSLNVSQAAAVLLFAHTVYRHRINPQVLLS